MDSNHHCLPTKLNVALSVVLYFENKMMRRNYLYRSDRRKKNTFGSMITSKTLSWNFMDICDPVSFEFLLEYNGRADPVCHKFML